MTRRSQLDAQAAIRAYVDHKYDLSAARDAVIEAAKGYVAAYEALLLDRGKMLFYTDSRQTLAVAVRALQELERNK